MSSDKRTPLEQFLSPHDDQAWHDALATLLPSVHAVDRDALRIWFAFFPLALSRALAETGDLDVLVRECALAGRFHLAAHVDTSHRFLYGHRYWPAARQAVLDAAARPVPDGDLPALVRRLAADAAARANAAPELVIGIAAVALMTLQQVGRDALAASPGRVYVGGPFEEMTPEEVLAARARDDSQGLFGFLRGERKIWTITFDENDETARFPLIHRQHLTTASANDHRDYRAKDPRAVDGPIPVQCRTGSCASCWVGVLGGAGKLTEVDPFERRRLREFGYLDTDEAHPVIRLACLARATGAVSIVIPPWSGCLARRPAEERPPSELQEQS